MKSELSKLAKAFETATYVSEKFNFKFDLSNESDVKFLTNLRNKMSESDKFFVDYFGFTVEVRNLDEFQDIDENSSTSELVESLLDLEVTPLCIIVYHNETWIFLRYLNISNPI